MTDTLDKITEIIEEWFANRDSYSLEDLQNKKEELNYYALKLVDPLIDAKEDYALKEYQRRKALSEAKIKHKKQGNTNPITEAKAITDCEKEYAAEVAARKVYDKLDTVQEWVKTTINTMSSRIHIQRNLFTG